MYHGTISGQEFLGLIRIIPDVPRILLEDLASTHHLLSQDVTESQLEAEKAAIETFCALIWGKDEWERKLLDVREFALPTLMELSGDQQREAWRAAHGTPCVFRNKGIELFDGIIARMKAVDAELGVILESCKGDYMVRFQKHGTV